jgi:hypothetical protein
MKGKTLIRHKKVLLGVLGVGMAADTGIVPKGKPYTMPVSPPKITGCKDNAGGTDTITTRGKWTLSVTKAKPYKMSLIAPKDGATFKSNALSGCVITVAPKGPNPITGIYNGVNKDTVSGATIQTKGTGCTSKPAKATTTVTFSPKPGPPPF